MKKIFTIISSALVSFAPISNALELKEALESAYNTNPKIVSLQQDFLVGTENFPRALAGFLPDINFSHQDQRTKSVPTAPNFQRGGNKEETNSLSVAQNIFSGGSGLAGLKAAKHAFEVAKYSYLSEEQKFLSESIKLYLETYEADFIHKASVKNLASAEQVLDFNKALYQHGDLTKSDLATAESNYSSALSQKIQSYSNFVGKKAEFKAHFNLDPENLQLPETVKLPDNFDKYFALVSNGNFNLKANAANLKQAQASLVGSKGALLPSAQISFSKNTRKTQGIDHIAGDKREKFNATTLSVKVPIFSQGGVEYSKIREAKYKHRKSVSALEAAKDQVMFQAQQVWENYHALSSVITARQKALDAAIVALDGVKQERKVGSKSLIDVINIEEKLFRAEIEKIKSLTQYYQTIYNLLSLSSKLTAKQLQLNVATFNPDQEFKKKKFQIIGF